MLSMLNGRVNGQFFIGDSPELKDEKESIFRWGFRCGAIWLAKTFPNQRHRCHGAISVHCNLKGDSLIS